MVYFTPETGMEMNMPGSSRIRQQARIPAYFSHSYWAEDRELNEYFLEHLLG